MSETIERVTHDDIRNFLQTQYPHLINKYAHDPEAIELLITSIATTGTRSTISMTSEIKSRIQGDLDRILTTVWNMWWNKEDIEEAMATAYLTIFWTLDLYIAVKAWMLCAMTAPHPIIQDFFTLQVQKYKSNWENPKCPFQRYIKGTAKKIVRVFLKNKEI